MEIMTILIIFISFSPLFGIFFEKPKCKKLEEYNRKKLIQLASQRAEQKILEQRQEELLKWNRSKDQS